MSAPAVAPPASDARDKDKDEALAAPGTAQAEAKAVAAPPVSPPAPDTDESVPAFDVTRVDRTGEAVIAGRAAPGATVELLRNGERHDQAVADQSGQFVMITPRLPPGESELTLRSRQPDGKQATSKQSVKVAVDAVESTGTIQSRAEARSDVPQTMATNRPVLDQAVGSSQAHLLPDAASPSAAAAPKTATTVVSRGDSLWRISRVTYGAGERYALVYRANRDHIRNPNRIYPGQIFVLPAKAR